MFKCFSATPKHTQALSKNVEQCVKAAVPSFWPVAKFNGGNRFNTKIIVDVAKTGFTLTIEPSNGAAGLCLVSSSFNGSACSVIHACDTEEELKLILQNSNLAVLWWEHKIKPLLKAEGFTKINRGEYELALGDGTTVNAMPTFGHGSACFLKHTANDLLPREIDDLSLMIARFKRAFSGL